MTAPTSWITVARPDSVETLRAELALEFPNAEHHELGGPWLESRFAVAPAPASGPVTLAFARRLLPAAIPWSVPSIRHGACTLAAAIVERLDALDAPWRWQLFQSNADGELSESRRTRLIDAALGEELAPKRKLLRRRTVLSDEPPAIRPDERVVIAGLVGPDHGWISFVEPDTRVRLATCFDRFPAGLPPATPDRDAPSRAHEKLAEAEVDLGERITPGQTCVDLGASPGGWTYHAVRRGASVIAVDRSPLRDDLQRDPRVTFVRGDAFSYEPPAPVDWLVCDLIAAPERSLELLARWLDHGWCRRFVITVKFRGDRQPDDLGPWKSFLHARAAAFRLRQLPSHRNEVSAHGIARG